MAKPYHRRNALLHVLNFPAKSRDKLFRVVTTIGTCRSNAPPVFAEELLKEKSIALPIQENRVA
jgi:hypothetical protein